MNETGHKNDKRRSIWETDIKDKDLINLVDRAMVWKDECQESSGEEEEEDIKEEIEEMQEKMAHYEEMVQDLQLKFLAAVEVIQDKDL